MTISLNRWPCGHVRNALNTRRIGDDREVCARCRSEVDQRHLNAKRLRMVPVLAATDDGAPVRFEGRRS